MDQRAGPLLIGYWTSLQCVFACARACVCYHDINVVRANMAAAVRTLLLLITDAVHQALLSVYFLFTKACWENLEPQWV